KAIYLSEKKRKCSWKKAATFESLEEARTFFHEWKNSPNLKMHIVEFKRYVEVPDPIFPEDHPYSVLKRIQGNERVNIWVTADLWFKGKIAEHYVSKQTLKRHRKILLGYGIDIEGQPKEVYHPPKVKRDDIWHTAAPELKALD
ncbi:hypothetical protein EA004_28415, partial [Vibrio anguillarum]|nr:hypothetical protein [Vibrio anguillarum]